MLDFFYLVDILFNMKKVLEVFYKLFKRNDGKPFIIIRHFTFSPNNPNPALLYELVYNVNRVILNNDISLWKKHEYTK